MSVDNAVQPSSEPSPAVAPGLVAPHGGALVDRVVSGDAAATLRREASSLASLPLDPRELADLELIATGAASPLTGFLRKRDVTAYNKILDDDFTFYLAPRDVGGGVPASWDRSTEMTLSTHLFDKDYGVLPCQSIFLNINTEGLTWTEIEVNGEKRYSTVLCYDFKFEIAPNTYIPDTGSRAEFVVRNAGTAQSPQWKLIEMRDLGGESLLNATSTATEPTTWGRVKDLYRDGPHALDLTAKENVLDNIELAYNHRTLQWYTGLLDDNMTFFLAPGDVAGGLPASWDRATEVSIHTKFFDPSYQPLPAQSIYLDIHSDGVQWTSFSPPGAPTETWYSTTLYYEYHVEIAPNTYISAAGSKAQFTVRNAGTDVAPGWRLVELRDLGGQALNATSTATQLTTWGGVKALYR